MAGDEDSLDFGPAMALRETGGASLALGAVADGKFLKRSGTSIVGASASGPIPSASRVVYVSKAGDDTNGDGSSVNPFLTITKALSTIASYADASASKLYVVDVGPGAFTDNFAIPAFVYIRGTSVGDPGRCTITGLLGFGTPSSYGKLTELSGTLTVNDASWRDLASAVAGFDGVNLSGTQTFDFSAHGVHYPTKANLTFRNCTSTNGNMTCKPDANLGDDYFAFYNCDFLQWTFTWNGGQCAFTNCTVAETAGVTLSLGGSSPNSNFGFLGGTFLTPSAFAITTTGPALTVIMEPAAIHPLDKANNALPFVYGSSTVSATGGGSIAIICNANIAPYFETGIANVTIYAPFIRAAGFATSVKTVSADYTIRLGDHTILVDASGGARTITLPPLDDAATLGSPQAHGFEYVVKKIDSSANAVTVQPGPYGGHPAETIDGAASKVLSVQYDFQRYQGPATGTDWAVVG